MMYYSRNKAGVARGLAGLGKKPAASATRRRAPRRLAFEALEGRLVLDAGPLVISEFMASNDSTLADSDGAYSDWIEVHNPTDGPINLDGWYVTDDSRDLTKWQFPSTPLTADGYLVVFASGKDRRAAGSQLHTNFQLDAAGEYLALVRPDGTTISHQFAPAFPKQREDFSYGLVPSVIEFLPEATDLTYRVPQSGDAALGTAWTEPAFDDASWTRASQPPPLLVTEAGTGTPDYLEIQNLAARTVNTDGWVVACNDATANNINAVVPTVWRLPASMTSGQVLYKTDSTSDNYWGSDIFWRTSGNGWVMIVDSAGRVADFVVWGYSNTQIAAFSVTINGFRVTAAGAWTGASASGAGATNNSLQRGGAADHNDATDWAFRAPQTKGAQNAELVSPFPTGRAPSLGFDTATTGLGGAVQVDVGAAMHGVNASLWARYPFQVDDPAGIDALSLRMRYNDGFVAYLNGQEIARRNAPDAPTWDSAATAVRNVADSLVFEEIDISAFRSALHSGANVLAIQGLSQSAADDNFLIQPALSGTSRRYFAQPTPEDANGSGFIDFVKDTKFSVDRGFFDTRFEVTITSATPGATIRYTTDGSPPSESSGTVYAAPISISRTTTLRAAAFKPDFHPTAADTQTYIFVDDVARQDYQATVAAGFPTTWISTSPDYGMDPDVIGPNDKFAGIYAATIRDDLKSLPTMSIVMDIDDLFGSRGIYSNPTSGGVAWERPASVELIYPDGTQGFQVNAGIRIQGGWFRQAGVKKHSFRLLFKDEYGPTKLAYPLFGPESADRFDTITLRAGANDGYTWDAARLTEQFVRDEFGRDLQRATGQASANGTFVHLYLNGVYWGLYNPTERPDHSFSATYNGGDKDEWDAIHDLAATNGDTQAWNQMVAKTQQAATSAAAYQELQGNNPDGTRNPNLPDLLDVQNYVDYLIVNLWGGNWDWPWKNWWAGRERTADSTGFKFYTWDYENTMGNNRDRSPLNKNALNNSFSSAGVPHTNLRQNAEYKVLFADEVQRLFFNDGPLTPSSLIARYRALADQVERAIVAESARWGDQYFATTPLTLREWQTERDWILNTYLPQRTDIVLGQFRSAGLYPNVDAPTLGQHGGSVLAGYGLTLSAPAGTIYYTLDGSDPRLPGGAVAPGALVYSGTPIALNDSALVKTRALSGSTWSALEAAQFVVGTPASAANLAITELYYNPAALTAAERARGFTENNDFEFIELRNIGNQWIDLTGVRFTAGVNFDFTGSNVTRLDPGQSVLVVRNLAAFQARYGSDRLGQVAGQYAGKLDNDGEVVRLVDYFDQPILDFKFGDAGAWPGRADGPGASLELIDPAAVPTAQPQRTAYLQDGNHWRGSSELGGSPGFAGIGPLGGVVINEVLSHSDPPLRDAIELMNPTAAAIDIGGWFLSDSSNNYEKFTIPAGTVIPAGGYLVYTEDDFNPNPLSPGVNDFALNGAHGDDVWLMRPDAAGKVAYFVDHVDFGATRSNESLGRWPNGSGGLYPMLTPTLDPAHGLNSGPRIGPLVISELNYRPQNPTPDDLEFIEIFNPTPTAVDLTNWQLDAGVNFDFPAGTKLASHAALVVVPFATTDSTKLAAFRNFYGIGPSIEIVGPYAGQLSDAGEKVRLERPDVPPPDEPSFLPRVLEDEVDYAASWFAATNGEGKSLNRLGSRSWGHEKASFAPAAPSPGTAAPAQVVGRHVFYNGSVFDGNDAATNANDDAAIAPDKTALLSGQTATFANYTSYGRGINGIMIDVFDLSQPGQIDAADFAFRVGNNSDPATWVAAPAPMGVSVRPAAGVQGSDRVTIIWPNSAIAGQWLQVSLLANADTGLAAADVFYFGNAIGETGNSAADARVDDADLRSVRDNLRSFASPVPLDFRFDFNRDGRVNAVDLLMARNHQTSLATALGLISVPGGKAAKGVKATSGRDGAAQPRFAEDGVLGAWLREFEPAGARRPAAVGQRPAPRRV